MKRERALSGADTVVPLLREEYERLLGLAEEAADIAAYDRAMARLANGQDELVPAEYANRIIDGESPVRVFRQWRAMTQTALAEASGVNRVQIADIEAKRKSGSVETIRKLADALGVSVDDLVRTRRYSAQYLDLGNECPGTESGFK